MGNIESCVGISFVFHSKDLGTLGGPFLCNCQWEILNRVLVFHLYFILRILGPWVDLSFVIVNGKY